MFIDWVMHDIETVHYVKVWDRAPEEKKWKIDYFKKMFKAENIQLVHDFTIVP